MTDEDFAPLKNTLLLRTAWGEAVERAPIWVMRQAGRYLPQYHKEKGNRDFFECCRNPEVASNLTIQPIDEYDGLIDAAIIFSDILVIPQAMGMEVNMDPGKGPQFAAPLKDPSDPQYGQVLSKHVDVHKELQYVFDAITLTRKKLNGRVPLWGFTGAPWTLLCYMVEGGGSKLFKEIKRWIYAHPQESSALLRRISEVCVDYLVGQVEAGAQMLQVFDSWAGELSPKSFNEFSLPHLLYIADELPKKLAAKKLKDVPLAVFAKGAWYSFDDLCNSKYNIIVLDWLYDPAETYKAAQAKGKVVQGNMDPGVLYGNEAAIEDAVKHMVKGFGNGRKGWIANLGHGVTPFIDKEKLRFFFKMLHRHMDGQSTL